MSEGGAGGTVSVTDVVITSSGRVYANFCGARGAGSSLFQLDRRQRRWIRVPSTLFPPNFAGLYGAEGDELILRAGAGLYGWFRLPDLTGGELRPAPAVSR